MNILELIEKKKHKKALTKQEIDFFVDEYTKKNNIADYQASSFLMACCLNNLNDQEAFYLTDAYVRSGKTFDYTQFPFPTIDKHSLGGVGDKVSLIFAPLIASLNIGVAKISGKGLGWTGGTIDKCASIGINCGLGYNQTLNILKKHKMFIMSQTEDAVPADKKIYDLRNASGSVDCDGLLAASVVSKKIALKTKIVYLDVKVGDGGFILELNHAIKLSKLMLTIFKQCNRKAVVHITDMTQPLGRSIGNMLEVKAAMDCLNGKWEDARTKQLIYEFVSDVLIDLKACNDKKKAHAMIDDTINSKRALNCFLDWASAQQAKKEFMLSEFFKPKFTHEIKATKNGYIHYKSARTFGFASLLIGVGKQKITDKIDYQAGIYLNKTNNECVKKGDTILTIYSSNKISSVVIKQLADNIQYLSKPAKLPPVIYKVLKN